MSVPPGEVFARFDDRRSGVAFELVGCTAVLEARVPGDVEPAIQEAERLARSGLWVAGFVSYEAASGLDPGVEVAEGLIPYESAPLCWFAIFDDRHDVPEIPAGRSPVPEWTHGLTQAAHGDAVGAIKDRLAAGDVYQVNLTTRLDAVVRDPLQLYASMTTAQEGAYSGYISTGTHSVLCASPELFFETQGRRIRTGPMKGTARRGRWPEEDADTAAHLLRSPKDAAEHVMIVDLVRNDLGRVCTPGTVIVEAFRALERYPTVWQLTSSISGVLREDARLVSVFKALFPCGSVTGAPKAASMNLIAGLEPRPRGAYCGAVGWLAPHTADARFAVAIRTATVDLSTSQATYGSGGGIVWDSNPTSEWKELVAKTSVVAGVSRPPGLVETIRFEPGRGCVNLDGHLERLGRSAAYFGWGFEEVEARRAISFACDSQREGRRVRVVLAEDGTLTVELHELPASTEVPLRLALAPSAVDSSDVRLFHKSSDRSRYDAIRASHPECDEVVMYNECREVTETTIANLAVRLDGAWWTPPLRCGLLPGVERERLLRTGALAERIITVEELRHADGLALVSSLRGWRDAVLVPPIPSTVLPGGREPAGPE